MFIKAIDALKPLEQLVLKAGSVLGNNFRRQALTYLISKDVTIDERQLAKGTVSYLINDNEVNEWNYFFFLQIFDFSAIRNLFEIKILTCAKGDLSHSNAMVPRKMILVSSIRKEIACECTGVKIPGECNLHPLPLPALVQSCSLLND